MGRFAQNSTQIIKNPNSTGVSLTFCLLHNAVKDLNSGPPRTNSNSGRVEDLNHGPPDFNSSALNNSAMLPFFRYAREITQSLSMIKECPLHGISTLHTVHNMPNLCHDHRHATGAKGRS